MKDPKWTLIAPAALLLSLPLLIGAQKNIEWTGRDTAGREITIPAADQPTVMIFIRPDQPHSRLKLQQAQTVLKADTAARVVLVVSGRHEGQAATLMQPGSPDWPVVLDPEYALSGASGVHVWPTTLVVNSEGREVAHLAGLGKSFANDLRAHLEHALGQIDDAGLERRLAMRQVVTENHVAVRHLHVAQQHMEKGQLDRAKAELAQAMEMLPDEAGPKLTAARLMIGLDQPREALALMEQIDAAAVPGWQMDVLRARALVALGQWQQAKSLLPGAMRLNPAPAEVHYLEGLVHQQEGNAPAAAASFRQAFELAAPNQKLAGR
jgi:Flp pilus assembly protein TadD